MEEDAWHDNAHVGCYIFDPAGQDYRDEQDERPKKKRKTDKAAVREAGNDVAGVWPLLLGGEESPAGPPLRRDAFHNAWEPLREKIDAVVNRADDGFVKELLDFQPGAPSEDAPARITTALIVSGPDSIAQRQAVQAGRDRRRSHPDTVFVQLQPSQALNLQTALKTIIRAVITDHADLEAYSSFLAASKALIPLPFDLELLQRYSDSNSLSRVTLFIPDVETFDTGILSDLLHSLASWSTRIPLVLHVSISTTVELFESRLPQATVSLLDAKVFTPKASATNVFFDIYAAIQHDPDAQLFLPPPVVSTLADLSNDQSTTVTSFTAALRYAYLSHFFANPLSLFTQCVQDMNVPADVYNSLLPAVRHRDAFQTHLTALAKAKDQETARKLLTDDAFTLDYAMSSASQGRDLLRSSLVAIRLLGTLHSLLPSLAKVPPFDLELSLLNSLPNLQKTELFGDIAHNLANLDGPSLVDLVQTPSPAIDAYLSHHFTDDKNPQQNGTLLSSVRDDTAAVLSQHADPASPSAQASINSISRRMSVLLPRYIETLCHTGVTSSTPAALRTTSPFTHVMSPAFLAPRHPLPHTLHPLPRRSTERALLKPSDYLSCTCCPSTVRHAGFPSALSRTSLPPTPLLFSLLAEAGNVVNVRDLWDAFCDAASSQLGDDAGADAGADDSVDSRERSALSLFYRALAELRYLGLVASSKRKPGVDCLARVAWMGL